MTTGDGGSQQPPGPDELPIAGSALPFVREPFAYRERVVERYGDVVDVSGLGRRAFLVSHPDLVQTVLVERAEQYRKPTFEKRFLRRAFGDSLPLSEGERWRNTRRALQPAFTLERVHHHGPTVRERVDASVADWRDGDSVAVADWARSFTFDVLVRTLFGFDDGVASLRADFEPVSRKLELPHAVVPDWIPTPTNVRYRRALGRLRERVEALVERRRGAAPDPTDVASLLLAMRGEETATGRVRDELLGLLFAGHEATATTLSYAVALLSARDDLRAAIRAEADAYFGEGGDGDDRSDGDGDDGAPTGEALPVTDRVIRETLRLYPPNHMLPRETRSEVSLGEYRLPAGASVYCSQWIVHRDERWWDDPGEFRPERWTGDTDRPEYAYFPFGGGPRHCIGMRFAMLELRLALSRLLQRADLTVEDEIPDPVAGLTLRPKGAVDCTIRRR